MGLAPLQWAQWGRAAGARHAQQLCHAGSKHAAMSCQLKPLGGSPCGKAFAGARDQCGGGGSAGSALPRSPGAWVPRCSHIPFPVPPSRLLHWPSVRLESPCLCACSAGKGPARKAHPSCLLPSLLLLWPHRQSCLCSPLGSSLPSPIDSVLRQPGQLSRERERDPGLGKAEGLPLTPSWLRQARRSWDEGRSWKAAPGGEAVGGGKRLKFLRAQPFRAAGTDRTGEPWPDHQWAASL